MFESGFLHSGSRLAATKPKDALTEAQVHFKSRSHILPVEQAMFSKLSQHFDLIWKSRAEETKSREEFHRMLLFHYDKLLDCISMEGFPETQRDPAAREFFTYSRWITESFKVVYLSDSTHKAKDLIQITARYYQLPQKDTSPIVWKNLGESLLSPGLNLRPVLDYLRSTPSSSSRVVIEIIQQLNERMIFVAETLKCEHGVNKAQSEFYRQRDKVLQDLIPRLGEIHHEDTRQICKKILGLLGGDVDILLELSNENVFKIIIGYLTYIDPFRNSVELFKKLDDGIKKANLNLNFHLMTNYLTDMTEIQEALQNYKERLPMYVYTPLALYSHAMQKIPSFNNQHGERRLGPDYEALVLSVYLEHLYMVDIDFFVAEPFHDRYLWLLDNSKVLHSQQEAQAARTFTVRAILKTIQMALEFKVPTSTIRLFSDHIGRFLKNHRMFKEEQQVLDFIASKLVDNSSPEETVETFFHQLQTRDKLDSDQRSVNLLKVLYNDEWVSRLSSNTFSPTEKVGDERLVSEFRTKLALYRTSEHSFQNHTLGFLEQYVDLRAICSQLADHQSQRNSLVHTEKQRIQFANHITSLAITFGDQSVFFKMIYSVLIGYRLYFLGSIAQVDSLIKVLQLAKHSNTLDHGLDYPHTQDKQLLESLEKKAAFLLLEMRANCLS